MIYDELHYVTTAGLPGESIDAEERKAIQEIRDAVPEVAQWGDLAIWMAYMGFSQDRYLISWETFRPGLRDEFLEYLRREQAGP